MGLLNNYHLSKQLTWDTPVKEEVFAQTSRNTKKARVTIRGGPTVYITVNQTTGPTSVHNWLRKIGPD